MIKVVLLQLSGREATGAVLCNKRLRAGITGDVNWKSCVIQSDTFLLALSALC